MPIQESKHYLGKWIGEKLYCYCKSGEWKPYRDCEEDWGNLVVVLNSKEIYELKEQIETPQEKYFHSDIHVRNNSYQRMLYAKIRWNEVNDKWEVLDKILAGSYSDACSEFGINPDKYGDIRAIHHEEFLSYEILEAASIVKLNKEIQV